MSPKAIRWALEQQTGGPSEKLVLLVLAIDADGDGICGKSTRIIAESASTDQRTARRVLDRLKGRGLVSWIPGSTEMPNTYRLPLS